MSPKRGVRASRRRPLARRRSLALTIWMATGGWGCGDRHQVQHRLWTLFDLLAAPPGSSVAMTPSLPGGIPVDDALRTQPDGSRTLNVVPAFAEGAPAAFVTTELWLQYDDVWLEPLFVQLADVVPGGSPPDVLRDAAGQPAPRIAAVGPKSAFYSPFWQVTGALIGGLTLDVDQFRTARALFDAGVPLTPLGIRTCALRPLDLLAAPPGQPLVEPTWGTALDDIPSGRAWYEEDGTPNAIGFFDFGPDLFAVAGDERDGTLVDPLPFFLFAKAGPSGAVAPVDALRVAAVGPLLSGRPADVAIDPATGQPQPHFGAYWRLYLAILPARAGPFHAAANPATAAAAGARGIDVKAYEGRVAVDAGCFLDSAGFPAACAWLDSQARIEDALDPVDLVPTEITTAAPLVFYDQRPVKR